MNKKTKDNIKTIIIFIFVIVIITTIIQFISIGIDLLIKNLELLK